MPISDYYWNARTDIQTLQQEFYATGLGADAVNIHLQPGVQASGTLLQIGEGQSQGVRTVDLALSAGFNYLAPGQSLIYPENIANPPLVPIIPGVDDSTFDYMQYNIPAVDATKSGINGGWVDRPEDSDPFPINAFRMAIYNNAYTGSAPDQILGINFYIYLLSLLTTIGQRQNQSRLPGTPIAIGSFTGDFTWESPGLFLLRLQIEVMPPSGLYDSGSLQQVVRAGRVMWGHK